MINRRKFCIANWKMNLNYDDSLDYLKTFNKFKLNDSNIETVICPSLVSTNLFKDPERRLYKFGAQNVSSFSQGSYTGDVSANMLENINCNYVITNN